METNQPNNNIMEHYGNFIINPNIIAGSICRRGVILSEPGTPPTVVLAIRFFEIEEAESFSEREGQVYRFLRNNPSPFVARIIEEDIITTNNQPSGRIFIMPASNGSNLHTIIRTHGPMPIPHACRMLVQIISGIHHCHSHNIVLRDITIGHIFFAEPNRRTAFLGDLSKSQIVPPNPAHPGKAWLANKCGSPPYVAPEILTQQAYDGFASDIYALGVVFFVTLFGRFPFVANTPAGLYAQILNGNLEFPAGVPPPIITLLRNMMNRNPRTRITSNAILSLPWIANIIDNGIIVAPIPEAQMQPNEDITEGSDEEDITEGSDDDDDMTEGSDEDTYLPDNNTNDIIDRDPTVGN